MPRDEQTRSHHIPDATPAPDRSAETNAVLDLLDSTIAHKRAGRL
jgi:hypothetical protein